MKSALFSVTLSAVVLIQTPVFAAEYPDGALTIYNASDHDVTAQLSNVGKFTLEAKGSKTVEYSTLSYACSDAPSHCKTSFYLNDKPIGSATIDVTKGKVVAMDVAMKIRTSKQQNVLRSVVIK